MKDLPSITVVVPAYNCEKTIGRTLDSLKAQTCGNMTILVVDDGSSDATAQVVERYAQDDSRIKLMRQSNAGTYMARVNAFRHVTTDYFASVDADDTVEPEMFEEMIRFAEENSIDVVQCDICGWPEGTEPTIYRTQKEVFDNYVVPLLYEGRGNAMVCGKIYRLRCLPDSFVSVVSLAFEDVLLNMQIFPRVRSFGCLHKEFYHYILNTQSTTNTYRERDARDFEEVVRCRRRLCEPLGLDAEGRAFYEWVVLNAGNVLYRASYAKKTPIIQRYKNIIGIVNLDEVSKAIEKTGGEEDRCYRRFQLQFARKFTVLYIAWTRIMAVMYAGYAFVRRRLGK